MRRSGSSSFGSLRPFSALSALALSVFASGCYSAGDGISPPLERVYFPVGLALTAESRFLVVANSDFDLQYNAGSLAVLRVDDLVRGFVPQPCAADADCAVDAEGAASQVARVCHTAASGVDDAASFVCVAADDPRPCGEVGERSAGDRLIYPGRCDYVDPHARELLSDRVEIGAFATDVVYRARPASAEPGPSGRVFIPVRGDATLHWADIDDEGRIHCGQELASGACDDKHRAGDDPEQENTRGLRMESEPFAVDVSPQGESVLVTNQTSGVVSLFRNEWHPGDKNGVALDFQVSGLPARPVGVASIPPPGSLTMELSRLTEQLAQNPATPGLSALFERARANAAPAFLVSFRNAPEIDLVRSFLDQESGVERPYASRTGAVPITVNSSGVDSRGIAVDSSARRDAELACTRAAGVELACLADPACVSALDAPQQEALEKCLTDAATTPLDVYVASRAPASLLVGRTTPAWNALLTSQLPFFFDTVPLTLGPSRVTTGKVRVGTDAAGNAIWEPRVFVTCFDSRRIFIYDPVRRRVETEVTTGRGPYSMAIDERHNLLFVGHFTDSFIGVVSIDRRFPRTYAKMLATVGEPSPPRASK